MKVKYLIQNQLITDDTIITVSKNDVVLAKNKWYFDDILTFYDSRVSKFEFDVINDLCKIILF